MRVCVCVPGEQISFKILPLTGERCLQMADDKQKQCKVVVRVFTSIVVVAVVLVGAAAVVVGLF